MDYTLNQLNYQTQFSPKINQVSSDTLTEIHRVNDENLLSEYIQFLNKDPIAKSCSELKALRATIVFGSYQHDDPIIQKFIQSNFENMNESMSSIIGQLASAMALGFSAAEVSLKPFNRKWVLERVNILDPCRVSFKGRKGYLQWILYKTLNKSTVEIPYKKCVHVINGYTANFNNPYGSPECKRAYPYYKAKKAIIGDMVVAGKNLATGITVAYVDPSVSSSYSEVKDSSGNTIIGSDGQPLRMSKDDRVFRQLQNIENNSILVVDNGVRIEGLKIPDGNSFWQSVLPLLDKYITRAFGVPSLVFEEGSGSFGMAGLSQRHHHILDSTVHSVVKQIQEEFIEKICKPLIILNYGQKENYGKFHLDYASEPNSEMTLLQNIYTAISMQIFDPSDPVIQNKIRDLLGLPPTENNLTVPTDEINKVLKELETQSKSY